MEVKFFESFTKSLDRIPAKGVLKSIEMERQMLKDDLGLLRKNGHRNRVIGLVV
jgi:hypothetical protein